MATIQKITSKGHRIFWRLYFPDGTNKEKYKTSVSKAVLQELLPDIMKIETLSRRNELTAQDLFRARNFGIITREEMSRFGPQAAAAEPHHLGDLRADFENKSKIESSGSYSHKVNLYRADHLEEWFKEVPVGQITQETIEKYRTDRQKMVCATTINHDLKILRKYLDIAVSKGWIQSNPSREMKLMREPRGRVPRCLYPEELKLLFTRLKDFRHLLYGEFAFVVRTLVYTGLRRGELCALKPENVKLHLRQIHVMGKGKKTRVIGIHRGLMKEFQRKVKKGSILPAKIHPTSITRAFKHALRKLGLPEALTLHSLRHTYISYLLERGIPAKRVKERAGHFSLTITERYTHALPSKTVDEDVLDFESSKV